MYELVIRIDIKQIMYYINGINVSTINHFQPILDSKYANNGIIINEEANYYVLFDQMLWVRGVQVTEQHLAQFFGVMGRVTATRVPTQNSHFYDTNSHKLPLNSHGLRMRFLCGWVCRSARAAQYGNLSLTMNLIPAMLHYFILT